MQTETADRNVERRQGSEHSHSSGIEADFLVRLPQRRMLDALTHLDDASRERHLAAVSPQGVGAHRQHHVCAVGDREEQDETCRVPNVCRIESRGPVGPWNRHQPLVRHGTGEVGAERRFDLTEGFDKRHSRYGGGTSVIHAQFACGAGYVPEAAARTISAAMKA
jgi:hypothetical protein